MAVRIESQELRVFHTVYTEGGFSRAADKLHVTQSAVSQTIANLELKLECVLFQRSPLQLTETGIRLLDCASSVLGEKQTLLDDLRNITRGVQKHLNIGINATVAELFGETLLSEFSQSDETRLQVAVLPSRRLFTAISSDQIELGFGPCQQTIPRRLRAIPLFEDDRVS